ncbi:MAG: DUF5698 domain-containing protein [Bacteroidota bacterium]
MSLSVIVGALIIMCMRIADVTLGTFRTILVVQAKKYYAALVGFFEVLIWIFAMRYIVQHMDHTINLMGYAIGFALGNILGITLEQKVALGYVQVNIVSLHQTDAIANKLRTAKFGVTILPAEGSSGGVSILLVIIKRRFMKDLIKLVESVDKRAFVTVQQSIPFRGFIHGSRV